ncbi:MAG TPA: SMP-30/gluconolactonase/LRE family protein, partial [Anseongella sp.]
FNSPNDAVLAGDGDLYFTDPPYGLEKGPGDPLREIPFHGIYKADTNGQVTLLDSTISRPNGIALTPEGNKLIVANSDPSRAAWFIFDLDEKGAVTNRSVLLDVTAETAQARGLPDGLKIDSRGTLFASGPGGIWIFSSSQKLLGKIRVPGVASNCALTADEKTLFITADSLVLRVKMR